MGLAPITAAECAARSIILMTAKIFLKIMAPYRGLSMVALSIYLRVLIVETESSNAIPLLQDFVLIERLMILTMFMYSFDLCGPAAK